MTASPKPNRKSHLIRILVLIVLVVAIVSLVMERNMSKIMLDLAYARAYSLAVETINQSVSNVMQDGVTYDELIITTLDAEGHVAMLSANTVRMNELATKTALMAKEELSQEKNQRIEIPMGAALGVQFLAGSGPKVSVQIIPVGAVNTQFISEFQSAGINQTRHKISLQITTTVRLVIPSGSQRVDVISIVPIAESIIIGKVPDTFVDLTQNQNDLLNLIP